MYVIDFKNRTIANFNSKKLSSFLNDVVIYNLTIKNYYFLNTRKEANSLIRNMINKK